jgi:hypothetical protein
LRSRDQGAGQKLSGSLASIAQVCKSVTAEPALKFKWGRVGGIGIAGLETII